MRTTEIATLRTSRTHYSAEEAAKGSLTVGDLMDLLSSLDEDTVVVYSNDNGYTYGRISFDCLESHDEDVYN